MFFIIFLNFLMFIHTMSPLRYEYQSSIEISSIYLKNTYLLTHTPQYINQRLPYTWFIQNNELQPAKEKIVSYTKLTIDNKEYNAIEYNDEVSFIPPFEEIKFNLTYYIVDINNASITHDNKGIGFALNFIDEKFSLIHQMKKKGLIDYLSFALSPLTSKGITQDNGYIYFGGVPEETKSLSSANCSVNNKLTGWNCKLKKIMLNYYKEKDIFEINQDAIFLNSEASLIFPLSVMKEIAEKTVMAKLIKREICEYVYNNVWSYFLCDKSILYDVTIVQSFQFLIGEYVFEFDYKDLFQCTNEYCLSGFMSQKSYGEQIVIGTLFLKKYWTNYDYEKEKIFFYSEKPFPIIKEEEKISSYTNKVKVCYICIMIQGIIMIFYLNMIKLSEHK